MSITEQTKGASLPKPALVGGGMIRAIVPQDFESAYRMAQVIHAAKMAPKSLDSIEKITVSIMHGLEVGLTPMAAVQSIAVINGNPSLWGDGMLALIEGSGLLEDKEETQEIDENGEWQWSRCILKRVGRKTPADNMFTRVQAMRAGLLNKAGPWTQYPDRMGKWRARAWSCRDLFSDVLKGLRQTEEMMDMVDITDRSSVTVAEPRRSDFQPAQAQQEPEPEGDVYPLFDETGVQIGELAAPDWYAKMSEEAERMTGPVRAKFLENNAEAAKTVWESLENEADAAHLQVLYQPLDEVETVKNWKSDALGEGPKMKHIKELIGDKAGTVDEVDEIMSQNAEFLAKLSAFKRDDINKAAAARKKTLE